MAPQEILEFHKKPSQIEKAAAPGSISTSRSRSLDVSAFPLATEPKVANHSSTVVGGDLHDLLAPFSERLDDGTVRVIAEGEDEDLERFAKAIFVKDRRINVISNRS